MANQSGTGLNTIRHTAVALGVALSLGAWAAQAQNAAAQGPKVTVKTCGAYTVRMEEGQDIAAENRSRVTLLRSGKTYATYTDDMVNLDACQDLTKDGVPEAILSTFSGGAHCCTTVYVYSLTTPPRLLLEADVAHSGGVIPKQLDGTGPLELVTGDWRFAYDLDMSFADSPALTQVYAYQGGRYVDATRQFPKYLISTIAPDTKDSRSGDYLYNYVTWIIAGQPARAETYLKTIPEIERQWLENYAPDIRQRISDVGMGDWPLRAGVPYNQQGYGIGGAFTKPGAAEYLALSHDKAETKFTLNLYQAQGNAIGRSAPLFTYTVSPGMNVQEYRPNGWNPMFTVRRVGGRDDAVMLDTLNGQLAYRAYQVGLSALTQRQNDPLAVAVNLLGDLENLATQRASLYRDTVKTEAQRQAIRTRVSQASTRAQPWLSTLTSLPGSTPVNLDTLGDFTLAAIEVTRENATDALVAGVVELGNVKPDQKDTFMEDSHRQTFAIFLKKQGGTWQVTRWQVTPRQGEGPMNR